MPEESDKKRSSYTYGPGAVPVPGNEELGVLGKFLDWWDRRKAARAKREQPGGTTP
jgi:hypothetical protein